MIGCRLPLVLATLALLAGFAAGQHREDDPRYTPDPREGSDPRATADPLDVDDPTALPEGSELFDALLERDDIGELRLEMGANPWYLLPYIQDLCQRRLAMRESEADSTPQGLVAAEELEVRIRRVAELADGVLRETSFTGYVTTVLAWNDEQLAEHRQREQWVRQARLLLEEASAPGEARRALTPLERADEAARELDDTVGRSLTLSLMGQVDANLGLADSAESHARQGIAMGLTVRHLDAVWDGLAARYEARRARKDQAGARAVLWEMHALAVESNNPQAAESVLDQLARMEDPVILRSQPRRVNRVSGPGRNLRVAARPFWEVQRPRPVWTFR